MTGEGTRYALIPDPDNHRLQIDTALTMFACLFPEFFDTENYFARTKE